MTPADPQAASMFSFINTADDSPAQSSFSFMSPAASEPTHISAAVTTTGFQFMVEDSAPTAQISSSFSFMSGGENAGSEGSETVPVMSTFNANSNGSVHDRKAVETVATTGAVPISEDIRLSKATPTTTAIGAAAGKQVVRVVKKN